MLSHILIIAAVATFSAAMRTFSHPALQKLGAAGILAASYLIGWFATGMPSVGAVCAGSWLLLPWLEILTRIRRLRLPLEKDLRHRTPPSRESFPALQELTGEIEDERFEYVEDAGWDWEDYQQYFRLFYKRGERTQASICLIDQNNIAFYYLTISSRAKDGTIWTTWNYPFSYSLKLAPGWRVNRMRSDQSFLEMHESHLDWLRRSRVETEELEEMEPDNIAKEIQRDLHAQVRHNLAKGVLKETSEGQIRYSWRGMLFIWFQFLRDLVRLS
ncbi:MAG TPA: hypothetical protein VHY22_16305 [Chthoniobacteraceae bacterium]|jgi:hypothetical protein|nr:hypothetical protein [Chthoniobacteraceae bacterium]